MVEEQLKNLKSVLKESTFKDFEFGSGQRQAVFRKLKHKDLNGKVISEKNNQRHQNRFRVFLTILAYCGMLALITSIVVEYINDSDNIVPDNGAVVDNPNNTPVEHSDQVIVLTNQVYENEVYPFKLSIPDNWLQKVKLENLDYGIRFFYEGQDGYQQDIFTIHVEKVVDRLKFHYDGGPDPSKEFALLGDYVYRYAYPLDMALTVEEDLLAYEKLVSEIPTIIQSFVFTSKENGFIGETPYLYGFTPHYSEEHGFEVNTPKKWQNLFKIEKSYNEMKFLFQKQGTEATEFLSLMALTDEEWDEIQETKKEEKEYSLITTKDGINFVAVVSKQNPYEETELFYPYEMLRTESSFVIESFQFLD
jgi:hypothetical protein